MSEFEIRGTSEQQAKLFAALAKAQGMFGMIEKTRTVKVQPKNSAAYTFDYAPLDEVLNKTREGLTANALAVFQPVSVGESTVTVRTILSHGEGAQVESSCTLSLMKPTWNYETKSWGDPIRMTNQEIGGVVTYWRRYPLCGILGVVAEEDDDANAADGNDRQLAPKTRQTPPTRQTAQVPDYRPQGQQHAGPVNHTPSPVATPVPPQVVSSAPAEPSSAGGVPVSKDVTAATGQPSPKDRVMADHGPGAGVSATAQATAAVASGAGSPTEQPGTTSEPMTDATGRAIRNALKAAGFTAATQDKAKAKVRSICDKASDDMTEAEGQLILKTLADEAKAKGATT